MKAMTSSTRLERRAPFRSHILRRTSAAIAVVAAGTTLAVSAGSPPAAAAQSSVLEGYYLSLWGRDGWGRGCQAKTPNGQVVTVPSGTIMEMQVVVTNPDGTKTTKTVRAKCVDGEWQTVL